MGNYGDWNQGYIIDGSGVYITRNLGYEGTFDLSNNISFDNGINGLVVHKTTNEKVKVIVSNNTVYNNGQTKREEEGRQDAGGLTINSGSKSIDSNVIMKSNRVTTSSSDKTYQCFGSCKVSDDSQFNKSCGGSINPAYPTTAFMNFDCSEIAAEHIVPAEGSLSPPSQMYDEPQY